MLIVFIGLTGCQRVENAQSLNDKSQQEVTNPTTEGAVQVLNIYQSKVEMIEPLENLARIYEETHPNTKIVIETVGGGVDYSSMLQSKFANKTYPDIFNNGGGSELDTWIGELEDLSDQPWVPRVMEYAKSPMTIDGKLYGMPYNVEGYGFIYNKDIFEKNGITELPKTYEALKAICEKLEANGVTSFYNAYQEWWVLGSHNFNMLLAIQDNPKAFILDIENNTFQLKENESAWQWLKVLDLTVRYGQKDPILTDYNTQLIAFANGEAAMIQQGNWIQSQVLSKNPNIRLGILPMPVKAGVNDKIAVDVPNNWVIHNTSPVKELAKDFLNWMVSSEVGQNTLVNEFKFIPVFKDISFNSEQLGDLANEVKSYQDQGKTIGWYWNKVPDGATNEIGAFMQRYISGNDSGEEMFDKIQKILQTMSGK